VLFYSADFSPDGVFSRLDSRIFYFFRPANPRFCEMPCDFGVAVTLFPALAHISLDFYACGS